MIVISHLYLDLQVIFAYYITAYRHDHLEETKNNTFLFFLLVYLVTVH